jgi:hypothetical protein
MTRITRLEVITDTGGREYVSWEDDNDVSWQFQDGGRTLKVFVNKVKPKSPVEEAYKEWMGKYPPTTPSVSNFDDTRWRAFQMGYNASQKPKKEQKWDVVRESVKWCEEHPEKSVEDYLKPHTPKPMNEVLDRLENKYKDAEENAASYITDEVVNRMLKRWETDPPSFLRFELSKTLEALITRWWDDVLYGGIHQDWDREVAIDDLIDQIQLWLPREQSHEGTQSASVIDLVDGYNDALTKIKSKLRNKKDT